MAKRQNNDRPEPGTKGLLIGIIFYFSTYLTVLEELFYSLIALWPAHPMMVLWWGFPF